MTRGEMEALAKGFAPVIKEKIEAEIAKAKTELRIEMRQQVDALRLENAALRQELEKRPGDFRGAWSPSETYEKSDGVQYGGHYWVAKATTRETPGPGTSWVLAVHRGKAGRDGRDLRAAS